MRVRFFDSENMEGRTSALDVGNRMLHQQLPAVQVDDRFADEPVAVTMLVSDDGRHTPMGVASVSATLRRAGSTLPPWTMQFVLRRGEEDHLCPLVTGGLPGEGAEVWVRPEYPPLIDQIRSCWPNAFNCRRLHLMAIDLPVITEPLRTRPLDPTQEHDLAAVVRVNNAAFRSHPDQAGMTIESVRAKLAGVGHSAQGVRLAEIDGVINGFCWTQIHHQRMLGEISVIGLHPDVHGRGLGAAMTAAGLRWLHRQGLNQAILYVEAGNTVAVRVYRRLGFEIVHDDVSWVIPGGDADG
ncbi:MAG: GNAT family N-acetyltransferase [Acidimicrobiia bacterium]|nr:GNAT family N-acetyltransferase [Acidimicrobiia bacterium]